ncbi:hypothetical protein ACQ4PT_027105 [Festuca glaucescens]
MIVAGQPDPFEGLDDRGWQWLAAREPTIIDGKLHFTSSKTNLVAERIKELSERQRKGEFTPNRDKDVLSEALETKEHGGHVRGVSSKMSIKEGFVRDRASYRSHSRYKDDLVAAVEKALENRFKDYFNTAVAEHQASGEVNWQMPLVDTQLVPRVIRAYEKEGSDITTRWHERNRSTRKPDTASTTAATMPSIRRSGFSQPCTDTEFHKTIGVDEIPELLDCPQKFVYGKPFLPDWAIAEIPWEMQRMHNWYMRACFLGLKGMQAQYPVDVFGPPIIIEAQDINFDFQDLHDLFGLNMIDVQLIRLWCMMQEGDMHLAKEKIGFLDPFAICEERRKHPLSWEDNHDNLAGCKTKKARDKKRKDEHLNAMKHVSAYIAHMMLKWKDRHYIWAPYHIGAHWIAFCIDVKMGHVIVYDSLDYPRKRYEEFIFVLQKAYHHYIKKGGGYNPDKPEEMTIRTNFPCHKQPAGSVYCGYYMYEFLRVLGRYATDLERVRAYLSYIGIRLDEKHLLAIGADLCRFILYEVVHPRSTYFHPEHVLATDDKFSSLPKWESQQYRSQD